MLIVQLYSGQTKGTGDFVYRIQQPAKGLATVAGVRVLNVDLVALRNWSLIIDADVLILHHMADADLLPVISRRRQAARPTIYEIADHFRVSHHHLPDAHHSGPPERHTIMETLVRRCDLVQTTSHALAESYQDLHERFLIFPNLIENRWLNRDSCPSRDQFVVGWGGSDRHHQDVGAVASALTDWLCCNDRTQLAIMGGRRIHEHFAELPAEKLTCTPPGDLASYRSFLDTLDVGLAPMLPTAFNMCRSDVKFLEYASRNVTPLCSNYGPYLRLPDEIALRFATPEEMVTQLDNLLHDAELRTRALHKAVNYVRSQRLFGDHDWAARIDAYHPHANSTPAGAPLPLHDCLLSDAETARLNSALRGPAGPAEQKLFDRVTADDPENYQLYFFQATLLLNGGQTAAAISVLKQAFALNRNSIRVAQLLIRSLILAGEIQTATAVLKQALKVAPELPTLLCLQGLILLLQGDETLAWSVLDRCIRAAPCLVEPRRLQARIAARKRDWQELEQLAGELRLLIPDSAEWAIFLAQVSQARGDNTAMSAYAEKALQMEPHNRVARALLHRQVRVSPA